MPGQKITGLNEVGNLEPRDFLVLARRGSNYKIAGEQFAAAVDLAAFREEVNTTIKQRVDAVEEKVDSELPQYIKKPPVPVHGQSLTYNVAYGNWEASYVVPANAVNSDILVYDESIKKWINKPMFLSPQSELRLRNVEDNKITKPANASNGEFLMFSNNNWEARPNPVNPIVARVNAAESQIQDLINKNFIPSPTPAAPNQVLTFSGVANKWVATDPPNMYVLEQRVADHGQQLVSLAQNWSRAILKPTPANPNDVLVYDGTTWVARTIQDVTGPLAFLQNQTNNLAAAQSTYILKPLVAKANDVLSFNGTTWQARNIPDYGSALANINAQLNSYIPFPNNPVLNNVLTFDGYRWVSKPLPEMSSSGGTTESAVIAAVQYFAVTTPPPGWFVCNGQTISNCQSLYPAFYSAITHSFADAGWGRNGADVKLPDLRGEFIRGWDNSRGVDNGRKFGSSQQSTIGDHKHSIPSSGTTWGDGDFRAGWMQSDTRVMKGWAPVYTNQAFVNSWYENNKVQTSQTLDLNGIVSTETRPRNVALLPCIRVFNAAAPSQTSIDIGNLAQQVNTLAQSNNNGFGAGTSVLQTNGYQKLPSGLIMQWGISTAPNIDDGGGRKNNAKQITFPIPFKTSVFSVVLTICTDATFSDNAAIYWDNTNTTIKYFTVLVDEGPNPTRFSYFAVGN